MNMNSEWLPEPRRVFINGRGYWRLQDHGYDMRANAYLSSAESSAGDWVMLIRIAGEMEWHLWGQSKA